MQVMFGHNVPHFGFAAMHSRPNIAPTSVILIFAVLTFLRSIYYRHLHPLAKVPGPFLASVSRLWLLYHALQGKQHLIHMATHRKYGPVIRVAPNTVMISDPQNFQVHHTFDKSEWWLSFRGASWPIPHGTELSQRAHNVKKRRVAAGVKVTVLPAGLH